MNKTIKEWDSYLFGKSVEYSPDNNSATVFYSGRTESWTYDLNTDNWCYNG